MYLVPAEEKVVVSRVDRDQARDPCCRPAHASGGRNARTIRERAPKEMQSDSEAAAENCNINRIERPWRVRMLHRSWCQVTLVPMCRSDPGKARQRFLTCSTCVRRNQNRRARVSLAVRESSAAEWRSWGLLVGIHSGDEVKVEETASRARSTCIACMAGTPIPTATQHGRELRC